MITAYYINLNKRTDRHAAMEMCLSKTRLNYERVEAVSYEDVNAVPERFGNKNKEIAKAQYATNLSHLKVIKQAKEKGLNEVLILEDDVLFVKDFEAKLQKALSDLPNDYDILYLGFSPVNHRFKDTEKPNLKRITNGNLGCWAMLVNAKMFDRLIEIYEQALLPNDAAIEPILSKIKAYAIVPFLCCVDYGYSDIAKSERNQHGLLGRIKKFCEQEKNYQ